MALQLSWKHRGVKLVPLQTSQELSRQSRLDEALRCVTQQQ